MKQRSVGVSILLSVVTCGIYGLYWLYQLAEDVNTVTQRPNATSGGMVLLLNIVTCGIYGFYWFFKAGEAMDELRYRNNQPSGSLAIIYLVLSVLGLSIVSMALLQSEVNKYAYPV